MGEEWRARDQDLDAISAARNSDPFGVLGPHRTAAGWVVRVFAPEAISVRALTRYGALTRDGALMAELPRRGGDFFEALIPSAIERPAYRIEVATAHGAYSYIDPYAFGPALGPLGDYLDTQSVLAFLRQGVQSDPPVAVVCNFTPEPRVGYRLGLPYQGFWREALNSDAGSYGGSNTGNFGGVTAEAQPAHGFPASATLTLPPLATLFLVFSPPSA